VPNLEVEVMLEDHPHLFVVDVGSVLEAEQLKGATMTCGKCGFTGKVTHVGTPGRKSREGRPGAPGQKSIFKEKP